MSKAPNASPGDRPAGRASGPPSSKPAALDTEKHASIAAKIAVRGDRPRAEVLAPFGLSEAEWEDLDSRFTARIVDEIRLRCGSDAPLEERYPLSASYAKAYATAVRDAQRDLEPPEDERTVRIPPSSSRDEPFSVLGASNRAAATGRAGPSKE